eukprot:9398030-Ditylum_brightwellii.AAC.1
MADDCLYLLAVVRWASLKAVQGVLWFHQQEGAPPHGVEYSLTCTLVKRASISSEDLVDCEAEDNNEGHTRSNVESQCTEESTAQTARSTSDEGSKAAPSTEDMAPSGEPATNIGN